MPEAKCLHDVFGADGLPDGRLFTEDGGAHDGWRPEADWRIGRCRDRQSRLALAGRDDGFASNKTLGQILHCQVDLAVKAILAQRLHGNRD